MIELTHGLKACHQALIKHELQGEGAFTIGSEHTDGDDHYITAVGDALINRGRDCTHYLLPNNTFLFFVFGDQYHQYNQEGYFINAFHGHSDDVIAVASSTGNQL